MSNDQLSILSGHSVVIAMLCLVIVVQSAVLAVFHDRINKLEEKSK